MKILTIVILATFLIGGCTAKQELSREEAANLIKESMKYPRVIESRIEAVRKWRANSDRANTKKLAATPTLFAEVRQPNTPYLAFPTLSSVNRPYIPIAFLKQEVIASNQVYIIANATSYTFGILTSLMHIVGLKLYVEDLRVIIDILPVLSTIIFHGQKIQLINNGKL